jgi:hypothetical protein
MENLNLFQEKEEPPSASSILKTSQKVSRRSAYSTTLITNHNTLSQKRTTKLSPKDKNFEDNDSLQNVDKLLFPINDKANAFRHKYYPNITNEKWNDWHWQVSNRIRTLENLERIIKLSDNEKEGILAHRGPLPFAITPYYASLIDGLDENQPLRRTVIMVKDEEFMSPGEAADPLNEEGDSPVKGLVHRYPDRFYFWPPGFVQFIADTVPDLEW